MACGEEHRVSVSEIMSVLLVGIFSVTADVEKAVVPVSTVPAVHVPNTLTRIY